MEVQSNMAKASIPQRLKAKEIDAATTAEQLITSPGQIPELVKALQTEKGSAKYRYEKSLRLVSDRRPELIYPCFDAFDQFFDRIDDKAAILAFAKRKLQNTRKQVVKKAERFLRTRVEIREAS
jgi:hypothetical protein